MGKKKNLRPGKVLPKGLEETLPSIAQGKKKCLFPLVKLKYILFAGKEPACQCRRCKRLEFDPWVGKIPWRRAWQPTLVFLPGDFMDRGAWWATVHGIVKSCHTQLGN